MHTVLISLDNLLDTEVLNYSTVFLKGRISCDICSHELNGRVNIVVANKFLEFSVLRGRLKAIVELELGINILEVIYSDSEHSANKIFKFERRLSTNDKLVKLLYVIPKDDLGTFQSLNQEVNSVGAACNKIVTGSKLLQTLIAERLNEEGFGRKTFNIFTKNGEEVCEVFRSSYTKQEFFSSTSEAIWNMTAMDLLSRGLFTDGVKILAFLSCTEYSQEQGETRGFVACGRGHFAMVGASGLHSWAPSMDQVLSCLVSQVKIDSSLLDDSCFRSTLGGCYATSLGAALHELGHIFDLVHSDCGIMSRGFNELDLFFTVGHAPINKQRSKDSIRRCNGQEISIRVRPTTKVTSVSFGVSSAGVDKEWGRDGEAYFHRSAAVLLAGHPWFTEYPSIAEDQDAIKICGLEVKAANGLRLIELHEEDDHLVRYWDFTKNPLKAHRFSLNMFDVKNVIEPSVLVQDTLGRILRMKLSLESIPFSND